jgi:hypothetical protein
MPPYNGGSPITKYEILFQNLDGTSYDQILPYCNGSSLAVVTNSYCDVPFTVFRNGPLNYVYKTLIVAKVSATNIIGTGSSSEPNVEGVTIETEPVTPPVSPTVVAYSEFSI